MLDPNHQQQIERTLGRALLPEELVAADSLDVLTEPVLNVAKQLRMKQFVLCTVYLHALVPTRGKAMAHFIDDLELRSNE